MLSNYIILLKKKFNFQIIKKNKIINFDKTLNLDFLNTSIFNYREDEIYILYAFKAIVHYFFSFFSKKETSLKDLYFKSICSSVDPIIGIGNEVGKRIFKFKNFYPNKLAICFQMSLYRSEHNNLTKKRLIGKKVDYFLSYDDWHTKYFNFLDTQFFEVGSLKSNIKPKLDNKIDYDILFISQYRENGFKKPISYFYLSSVLSQSNSYYVFKIISDYCKKNNKRLGVSLASNRDEKKNHFNRENEISFFKSINENFNVEKVDGHNMASKANLIVSLDSTLGVELLYKGYKVLLINPTGFFGTTHFLETKPLNGFCWVNESSKDVIFDKIHNLLSLSSEKFKENLKIENIQTFYEKDNQTLKKIVNKHLK